MKVFFDTEFTGLHQNTKLISFGVISEGGKTFYAEFNDFKKGYANRDDKNWITENVIPKLKFYNKATPFDQVSEHGWVECFGNSNEVKKSLSEWLSQFDKVELWSDCLSYDFVLFNQLWGHAFDIPENVSQIPFDICTLFEIKGIDPNINRKEYAGMEEEAERHNALWDAKVIKKCYELLVRE